MEIINTHHPKRITTIADAKPGDLIRRHLSGYGIVTAHRSSTDTGIYWLTTNTRTNMDNSCEITIYPNAELRTGHPA